MKSESAEPLVRAWQALASPRTTVALLLGLTAVFSLAPMLSYFQPSLPIETQDWIRILGFDRTFSSGWFILILILLLLNQAAFAISNWRELVAGLSSRPEKPLGSKALLTAKPGPSQGLEEFPAASDPAAFKIRLQAWLKYRRSPGTVIQDTSGDVQFSFRMPRYSGLALWAGHLGLLLILFGALESRYRGLTGQVQLEEGKRIDYIQVLNGSVRGWPQVMMGDRPMPGLFKPGFELVATQVEARFHPGTDRPRSFQGWLQFYENGKLIAARRIGLNRPARYKDLTFYQSSVASSSERVVTLAILDRKSSEERILVDLAPDREVKVKGATFKVLTLDDTSEDLGPSAQLEYTEDGGPTERFWVFQRHPKYDFVRRKDALYHFDIESVDPRYGTILAVSRDPGAGWVLAGAWLAFLGFAIGLLKPIQSYWVAWRPGRVVILSRGAPSRLGSGPLARIAAEIRAVLSLPQGPAGGSR